MYLSMNHLASSGRPFLDWVRIPVTQEPVSKSDVGNALSIARKFMNSVVNPFDYEQKYEEDDYGDELGSNARFWRVLLDEGQAYDAEMIEGWRDTLDVLLVFVRISTILKKFF